MDQTPCACKEGEERGEKREAFRSGTVSIEMTRCLQSLREAPESKKKKREGGGEKKRAGKEKRKKKKPSRTQGRVD